MNKISQTIKESIQEALNKSESSTTHWACQERLEEFGGEVTCCECIQHEWKNKIL